MFAGRIQCTLSKLLKFSCASCQYLLNRQAVFISILMGVSTNISTDKKAIFDSSFVIQSIATEVVTFK